MDRIQEVNLKVGRLIDMLVEEDLGGVLINTQPDFTWLTAGGLNGIDQSQIGGAGTLLVRRDGRRFVLASRIEMARLQSEPLAGLGFEPVVYGWEEEKANPLAATERAMSIVESGSALGADFAAGGLACNVESRISAARYQLTESEIERYRELGRDTGEALGEVAGLLKPGQTEIEVARIAMDALAARGARALVMLVGSDERLRLFRHPVPTGRRWEQTVMYAVCARRDGLIASASRIVAAGPVSDEQKKITAATARVNAKIFAATRPGTSGRDIYDTIARAYGEEGFPGEHHLHHQGGAIGYKTRDWVAHPKCDERVHSGQAFGWNPSITGTKVEETCIAFDSGIEIITATEGWPSEKVELEGRQYLLPAVKQI